MLYEIKDGKIQTKALEYSVAYNCNLTCSACSHMSPHQSQHLSSLESFTADVERLSPVLHAKDIRLLGGEPLLNPDIVGFLKIARRSGIADTIMVTTNGLLLSGMKDEFWENVDFIWVSLYQGASPPERALEKIKAKAKESNTRIDFDYTTHFRTTLVTEPHPDGWVTDMIFKTCGSAHLFHCHMLHEGRIYKCSCPAFLPEFLSRMGKDGHSFIEDGLDIHASQNLSEDLKTYLFTPKTLKACNHCLGYVGKWQEHHMLSKEALINPAVDPVSRQTHLSKRKFLQEAALYYYRRGVEKLTGQPKW
jgi:Radical SAM superfamily/4Fe-4S single cluster domain